MDLFDEEIAVPRVGGAQDRAMSVRSGSCRERRYTSDLGHRDALRGSTVC